MEPLSWSDWLLECADDPHSPTGLHPDTLGMLTGQDKRALAAIAASWQLYASSDDAGQQGALAAVRALLPALQPKCRFFARELIAFALDWGDRDRLWPLVDSEIEEGCNTVFHALLEGLFDHSVALVEANAGNKAYADGWRGATNTCLAAIKAYFSGQLWPIIHYPPKPREHAVPISEAALIRGAVRGAQQFDPPPSPSPRARKHIAELAELKSVMQAEVAQCPRCKGWRFCSPGHPDACSCNCADA